MKKRLVVITWVSGSGKTTIQDKMISSWEWSRPNNVTTRKPRDENIFNSLDWDWDYSSDESNEYIFFDKIKFEAFNDRWYFLETTNYWWNRYWILNALPKGNIVVIVDPIGRAEILRKKAIWELEEYSIECFYIEIPRELQLERLTNRWDNPNEIKKRTTDFGWFKPQQWDIIINWNWSIDCLVGLINSYKV